MGAKPVRHAYDAVCFFFSFLTRQPVFSLRLSYSVRSEGPGSLGRPPALPGIPCKWRWQGYLRPSPIVTSLPLKNPKKSFTSRGKQNPASFPSSYSSRATPTRECATIRGERTPLRGAFPSPHMKPVSGFPLRFCPPTLGLPARSTRASPGSLPGGGSHGRLPEPMYLRTEACLVGWNAPRASAGGCVLEASTAVGRKIVAVPRRRCGRGGAGGAWMFYFSFPTRRDIWEVKRARRSYQPRGASHVASRVNLPVCPGMAAGNTAAPATLPLVARTERSWDRDPSAGVPPDVPRTYSMP